MFPARRRLGRILLIAALLLATAFFVLVRPPGDSLEMRQSHAAPARALPPEPGSLLDDVLKAHGGIERWRQIEVLRARIRFGGMAFRMRLVEPQPTERWIEVQVHAPRAILHDFPEPGMRGVFTPARVWIESTVGLVLQSLDDPRKKLLESRRRQLWWDELDLLYFAGYAIWNYLQGPFLLLRDGVEVHELPPWTENGETWRRLAVRFHGSIPTHSRQQVFYYGPDLLQRRHDYQPDVYASWARAAHYTTEYREFDGLRYPTARRVVPRGADGRPADGPVLVWIEIRELRIGARD